MIYGSLLIIDDDAKLAEMLAGFFRREGFTVRVETDPIGALSRLNETALPDVFLVDWMMPGVDGPELCRAIRRVTSLPIIVLSARGDEVAKTDSLEAGADRFVRKPCFPRDLLSAIRDLLLEHRDRNVEKAIK